MNENEDMAGAMPWLEMGLTVAEPTAIEQLQRGEIDIQISTAHRYPRSMVQFKRKAMEMVTLDEETAQSCIFRRPVGKKNGKVEYAEGKSIRMAEIVGACYGNIRVGSMITEMTERHVKARGFAHDLESNFASTSECVESTVKADGQPYSERMRMVIAKAALAKARRDATFQIVPGALCKSLEDAARTTAIGTSATLGKRRALLMDWINKIEVDPARVWAALGINGVEDVGLDELETLTGIKTSLKEKETSVDDAFPPIAKPIRKAAAPAAPAESVPPDLEPVPPAEPAKRKPGRPPNAPAATAQPPPPPAADAMGPDDVERADILAELESRAGDAPRTFSESMRAVGLGVVSGWQQTAPTEGLRRALKLMQDSVGR